MVGAPLAFLLTRPASARADVLTHKVKRESLDVTVVEKGTLESAENADIVCRVRAGNKGYASTINWVIEDGAKVHVGQTLIILDDSALQDQLRDHKIVVDQAVAAKVKAEKDFEINIKKNEKLVAEAENLLALAEIELTKFSGLEFDPHLLPFSAAGGALAALTGTGVFQQEVDDQTGQVQLARSEVEQNRERAAWADRMVKMRYMSPAQAQAERSRLDSSLEKLRSLDAKRINLRTYDWKQRATDLRSKVANAKLGVEAAVLTRDAEKEQAHQEMATRRSVYEQAIEKLNDINQQVAECRITAPQAGMVVYFKNESSRFSSSQQGLIEQGAQVKEGQKLLRIPNLDRMQVNTKVHEAMVGRIRGDVRVSTGIVEQMRVSQLAVPDPLTRAFSQRPQVQEMLRDEFKDQEYKITRYGQRATVRVDSHADKILPARVKSVAAVASQADSWISDVKLFPTIVLLDGKVEGLKPDGTAEVTIQVTGVDDVLAIPVQAVVGGTEMGATRKVWVQTATGSYEERAVVLGLYNERMVEVREGLKEDDEVVINPKVLMGDAKTKTRDGSDTKGGDQPEGQKKGYGGKKKEPTGAAAGGAGKGQ